jgi:hypothetical protein
MKLPEGAVVNKIKVSAGLAFADQLVPLFQRTGDQEGRELRQLLIGEIRETKYRLSDGLEHEYKIKGT